MKAIVLNLNPAYDCFVSAKGFEIGKETIGNIDLIHCGGKGLNVMRALYEYGLDDIEIISFLFGDNSLEYKRELEKYKYKSQYEIRGRIRENFTINDGVKETRLSFEGSSVDSSAIDYLETILSLKKRSVIVVSGSLPKGFDKERFKELLIKLKENDNRIVIDSRSFDIKDILEVKPHLIKPNEEELRSVFNLEENNIDGIVDYFTTMTKDTEIKAMVSRGPKESYLIGDGFKIKAKVPVIKVKSTIGAGDSMIAGFVTGKVLGYDEKDSFKLAISFGSSKCLEDGVTPPNKENIENLFNKIEVSEL